VLFLDSASHVLKSLNTWLPDINIKTIPGLSVPSILFYISTGILILAVFDIALNRLFHSKEKREGRSL
jgi:hypothetical protein